MPGAWARGRAHLGPGQEGESPPDPLGYLRAGQQPGAQDEHPASTRRLAASAAALAHELPVRAAAQRVCAPTAVHAQREASCHYHRKRADWPANCRGSCSSVGHAVHAQDSPVTCRDVGTNAAQQVLRGTHRRHARRVLAGAREAPAGGCSSSGRGSDGKCTLLINRSVVTSPSSLRTSTSAQIAQTAERQLCSRRGLTGDADAAARTAPVGRDGMCTPASRLGPQGGSGRGEQAKVTFSVVSRIGIPTYTPSGRP